MTGSLKIVNLGGLVTGRLGEPVTMVEGVRCEDGVLAELGASGDAETVVDASRAVAIPGLIDSHAHVVFGDWTPRQSALGWIESSMHGGSR